MMVKKISRLTVLAFILPIFLFSCDGFLLGPTMNLNRDDPNEAFGRLECQTIDTDEIRVMWDWYDIERALRGIAPVYDEIVIKHSTGSYPASRLGGESYTLKSWDASSNPSTSTVFTDLKRDQEHYFALYAHETGGGWMAPVYTSEYLDKNQSPWSTTLYVDSFYPENAIGGDMDTGGGGASFQISSGFTQILSGTIFNTFYYDLNDGDSIVYAILSNFNIDNVPVEATLIMHPMRARWSGGDSRELAIGGVDQYMVDRSIQVEHTFSAGETVSNFSIDITELFAKSQYHRTNGIFLYTDGGQIDISSGDFPTIDVEIMENW